MVKRSVTLLLALLCLLAASVSAAAIELLEGPEFGLDDQQRFIVTFTTSTASMSYVEYGVAESYGEKTSDYISLDLLHQHVLENVTVDTTYHYRIVLSDFIGNEYAITGTFVTPELGQVTRPAAAKHIRRRHLVDMGSGIGAAEYQVQRAAAEDGPFDVIATVTERSITMTPMSAPVRTSTVSFRSRARDLSENRRLRPCWPTLPLISVRGRTTWALHASKTCPICLPASTATISAIQLKRCRRAILNWFGTTMWFRSGAFIWRRGRTTTSRRTGRSFKCRGEVLGPLAARIEHLGIVRRHQYRLDLRRWIRGSPRHCGARLVPGRFGFRRPPVFSAARYNVNGPDGLVCSMWFLPPYPVNPNKELVSIRLPQKPPATLGDTNFHIFGLTLGI